MRDKAKYGTAGLALSLLAIGAADAADWVSVAKTDNVEVFVNAAGIGELGDYVTARTKENFSAPQPAAKRGSTYLSSRNTYRIDCARHRLAYSELKTFAGPDLTGAMVQKATSSDRNLQWMDATPGTVFGQLLDYACSHVAPPSAASGG